MEPMYWVFLLGILAILSLISFVYFFIKDQELKKAKNLKHSFLILDCLLILITIASSSCAVILYLDIQNQITSFTL